MPAGSARRAAIAERMTTSKQTIPHLYIGDVADITDLRARRSTEEISVPGLLTAAIAQGLHEVPEINSIWTPDGSHLLDHTRVSVAVATADGIVAPSVEVLDEDSPATLSVKIREAAERARVGRLVSADLAPAGFTLSSIGGFHVRTGYSIITPPQCGVLCAGAAYDQVTVLDGDFVVRRFVNLSLSADHRVVDGEQACRFLTVVSRSVGGLLGSATGHDDRDPSVPLPMSRVIA